MLEEIQGCLDAKPFVRFRIVLANGDRFDVQTPNMFVLGDSVSYLIRLGGEGYVAIRNTQLAYVEVPA